MLRHLVVVEAYDGLMELVSDDPDERDAARGLGLPLDEIAAKLGCRITTLDWDEWRRYESAPGSFPRWMPTPATRPVAIPPAALLARDHRAAAVTRRSLPARDPDSRRPLLGGELSPRSHGLLADSDPLFLLGYCLNVELQELHRDDPFDAVLLAMWGGLGYVAQLARATGAPGALDVPFAVVVTDTSARRQDANQEGAWTRPAVTRRQMEDVSLALADLVFTFGSRGDAVAAAGRLPEARPAVRAPRRIPERVIAALAARNGARPPSGGQPLQIFLQEPQDAASGVLATLDAVALLRSRGVRLPAPVLSTGPEMVFAPMKPRGFVDYWSSRASVRELVGDGLWAWTRERRADAFAVRLYPSLFDHLPSAWTELARGSLVLLSPAAAEGLAPGHDLPAEVLIEGEPTPERVAACLERLLSRKAPELDEVRRHVCGCVASAHGGSARGARLDAVAAALRQLVSEPPPPQDLGRTALAFLDRRQPLRALAAARPPASGAAKPRSGLTVVVTCHEMGGLLEDTIESVWASTRRPDELLLVDDGSREAATLDVIASVERAAGTRGLPLTVLRQGNRGLAAARNAGLAAATRELISFLDGDDVMEPAFYEVAASLLDRYPDLGGVAAWALCFGEGVPDGFWNAPQPELPLLLVENPVFVPCMMRTETVRRLGGYDTRQRYNYEDWELSVRLVASGHPIVTIPRYLQRYRIRADSLLRTRSDVQHQRMREIMLERHRDTVARFAVETPMLLEHQLARHLYAVAPATRPDPAPVRACLQRVLGAGRRVLARASSLPVWRRP